MTSLASMFQGFNLPQGISLPTPEQRAEMDRRARESDEREENRRYLARIKNACIPEIFRNAEITECDGFVRKWLAQTLQGELRKDLLLMGKAGRGKTFAACACGNALLRKHRLLFTDAKDMLDDIQAGYGSYESEQALMAKYTLPEFLIVDDFGESDPTEWVVTHLFQIIKRRHAMCRPTIYTTMYPIERLILRLVSPTDKDKATAILSRFSEAWRVTLEGPDRRRQCKTA